jgi:hypothetical protein
LCGSTHQLTSRSPAKFSKCLGLWALSEIAGKRVALFKSDLHLATEGGCAGLLAENAGELEPIATRPPQISTVVGKPGVETVDFFGFVDATDHYGVAASDPDAHTEEMDDATLPLALSDIGSDVPWLSIRNASDPQVATMATIEAEKAWAEKIYEKYGYWTTVGSAIACWAVIADL